MMPLSRAPLWATLPDGRRVVSRRVWFLLFLTPALFALAAALFAGQSLIITASWTRTTGEVVRVYAWEGWNPVDGATTDYSPVFRYEFAPGETTEASTGQSSPNWNFPPGTRRVIYFNPGTKGDVRQDDFEQLWALPATLAGLAAAALVPALIAFARIRRWQRRASATPSA
ncbi:MAG: DUF3592 domain-containing protein [Alphaproteobacteria bacterium]|nr:MAG: DUF3592 domain-containing protein [Alphaproteobacteria bacterium]